MNANVGISLSSDLLKLKGRRQQRNLKVIDFHFMAICLEDFSGDLICVCHILGTLLVSILSVCVYLCQCNPLLFIPLHSLLIQTI